MEAESENKGLIEILPLQPVTHSILEDNEKGKDNPVSQPLSVILAVAGLNGADRPIGRVDESNKCAVHQRIVMLDFS